MRKLKKTGGNMLMCKSGTTSYVYLLIICLFIFGNYYIIKIFTDNENIETREIQKEHDLKSNIMKFVPSVEIKQDSHKVDRVMTNGINQKKLLNKKFENAASSTKFKFNQKVEATKKHMQPKILILVLACNRPSVGRCLDKIFKYKPKDIAMPVVVSQDCGGEASTASVIKSYRNKLTHIVQPDTSEIHVKPQDHRYLGYYKIARHYKWALETTFNRWKDVDSVIIIEDDLDIAPDFFDYFIATRPLLDADDSIFCVSAWNDIGKSNLIDTSAIDVLYRSDFFPGLGWLLTRNMWNEIGPKWPLSFWDDWLREPENRKNRVCIRPEISRSKTFGRIGVSQGQFFDQHLKFIKLNDNPFPFRDYDLSYLMKEKYDEQFAMAVYNTREHPVDDVYKRLNVETIRITYQNKYELDMLTRKFGLLADRKAGVPRTAYKGILTFFSNGKRIYLAPKKNMKDYY